MHYSLSDIILDLIQNSVEADALVIRLDLLWERQYLTVRLDDNGCGMTEGELAKVRDPFFSNGIKHKQRRVGLGIPFLIQTIEQTDGLFEIKSVKNQGTSLTIRFDLGNYDTPPEGDWAGLFLQTLCFDGDYELIISRMIKSEDGSLTGYTLQRSELQEILGNFNESGVMLLLRDYLRSQEEDLSPRIDR